MSIRTLAGKLTLAIGGVPWYRAGGSPTPIAAYRADKAVSLAASYVNLISPGTHDLTVGAAPDWSAASGWEFLGAGDWLATDIVPATGWTMIVKYSSLQAGNGILAGATKTNAQFALWPYQLTNDAIQFGSGGILTVNNQKNLYGTIAVSGNLGYRNGVAVAGTIGAWADTAYSIYISGANDGSDPPTARLNGCFVQAMAVWDKTLSASQILAIHNRLIAQTNYKMVVYDGDSITLGLAAAPNDYPSQTTVLLGSSMYAKRNTGIGGQTWADMVSTATDVDKWYDAERSKNIVVGMAGFNELNTGGVAADIYAQITTYVANRQAAGWLVVVNTTPKSTGLTGSEETERQALNALILTNSAGANATADVAAAPNLQDPSNATYFTDGTHLTAAGCAAAAAVVYPVIAGL